MFFYINRKFQLNKETTLLTIIDFLSGRKSSLNILVLYKFWYVWIQTEIERTGSLHKKKDMGENAHKRKNWAWEPNESKDSCLVREEIMEVVKLMVNGKSTFIKWFIR